MSEIIATRIALQSWASKQPEPIQSAANVIIKNLKHLSKEPDDEILIAQTKINIARLEGLRRAVVDGR